MGMYGRLVNRAQSINQESTVDHTNDKWFTAPNVMTVSRPLIALEIARRLVTGSRKKVAGLTAAMGATDAEGNVARLIDKYRPDSGRGTTDWGKGADPIADSVAVIEVSLAALAAPKVTKLGKLAVGIMLVQELHKTRWALRSNQEYKRATGGEKLSLAPSPDGKESMFKKLVALEAAVATHDTEDTKARNILSGVAVFHAVSGAIQGERARRAYEPIVEAMIANVPPSPIDGSGWMAYDPTAQDDVSWSAGGQQHP